MIDPKQQALINFMNLLRGRGLHSFVYANIRYCLEGLSITKGELCSSTKRLNKPDSLVSTRRAQKKQRKSFPKHPLLQWRAAIHEKNIISEASITEYQTLSLVRILFAVIMNQIQINLQQINLPSLSCLFSYLEFAVLMRRTLYERLSYANDIIRRQVAIPSS